MAEQPDATDQAPRNESLQDLARNLYRMELSAERAASIGRELARFNRAASGAVAPAVEPTAPFRGLLIGGAPRGGA
jgi:hypothetical protein